MTRGEFLTFVSLLGTVGGVVFILLRQLPVLAQVTFRQRLTLLQERAFDLALDGLIDEHDECYQAFILKCELAETYASQYSILRGAIARKYLATRGPSIQSVSNRYFPSYAEMKPEQRKIMNDLDAAFSNELGRYLLRSSPSGWLLGALSAIGSFVLRHTESRTENLVQEYGEAAVSLSKRFPDARRGLIPVAHH